MAAKKKTKKKAQKVLSRPEAVLKVLARKKEATLAEVLKALKVEPEDAKFYASTILRLAERKLVTRKDKNGVWVYKKVA